MTPENIDTLLQLIRDAGYLTVEVGQGIWLVPVPRVVTTVKIVNEHGFTPHRQETEERLTKPLLLLFNDVGIIDRRWALLDPLIWDVVEDQDIVDAFEHLGIDISERMAELDQ